MSLKPHSNDNDPIYLDWLRHVEEDERRYIAYNDICFDNAQAVPSNWTAEHEAEYQRCLNNFNL